MDYKAVYKKMFANPKYNTFGSQSYALALAYLRGLGEVSSVLDVGSGHGAMVRLLAESGSWEVIACDLDNNLLEGVEPSTFIPVDLSKSETLDKLPNTDALVCLDVLEHVEEEHVDNILRKFSTLSPHCFFSIANHSDIINGVELHLIQQPMEYWTPLLEKYFVIERTDHLYNKRLMIFELTSRR